MSLVPLTIRTTREQRQMIRDAADVQGKTVSSFVLAATTEMARRVLERNLPQFSSDRPDLPPSDEQIASQERWLSRYRSKTEAT